MEETDHLSSSPPSDAAAAAVPASASASATEAAPHAAAKQPADDDDDNEGLDDDTCNDNNGHDNDDDDDSAAVPPRCASSASETTAATEGTSGGDGDGEQHHEDEDEGDQDDGDPQQQRQQQGQGQLHPAMEAPQPRTAPAPPASVRPPILRRPRIGSHNRLGLALVSNSSGVSGGNVPQRTTMSRTLSGGAALHLAATGGRGGAHYRSGTALIGARSGSGAGSSSRSSRSGAGGSSGSNSTPQQLRGILRRSALSDSHLVRDAARRNAAAGGGGALAADAGGQGQANATFDAVSPPSSAAVGSTNRSTDTNANTGTPGLGQQTQRDSREELRQLMQAPVLDWTAIRQVQARHYSHSRQASGSTGGGSSSASLAASSSGNTCNVSTTATGSRHLTSGSISDLSYGGLPSAQALLASSHASMNSSGGSRSSGGIGIGVDSRPGRNASWDVVGGTGAAHHPRQQPSPHRAMNHHRNESFGGGPHQDHQPHQPQHQRRRTVTDIFAQAAGESTSSAAMFTRLLNAGPCLGSSSVAGGSGGAAGSTATIANVYSHLLAPAVPRNTGLVPRCGTSTGSSGTIGLSLAAAGAGGSSSGGGGGAGKSHASRDNSDGGSCSAVSTGVSDGNESEASTGGRRSAGLVLARRPSPGIKRSGSAGSHSRGSGHGLVLAKSHSKQSVTSLGSADSGGSSRSGCSGGGPPRRGLVLAKSTDNLGATRPTPSTITVDGLGMRMGMSRTSGMPGSLGSMGSLGNPSPRSHHAGERGGASDLGMSAPASSSSLVSAGMKRSRGSGLVLAKQPGSDKKTKTDDEKDGL